MSNKQFQGTINIDVRDSKPDWAAYEQPRTKEGAPNVLYIVLDDAGFSSMSCYGGLINTPNIDKLAKNGAQYTQWHTTALCSPTRSCLLTGRNHTTNGMSCITEASSGFPGSNANIPFECATIAEVLNEHGYNTYMLGKWHLSPADQVNMAATKRQWPLGRGFERFYGFLGGETNQYYPNLIYDNHPVAPPKTPEEGYHLTEDITDKAIEFITDSKVIAPDKPFFMYYAPGATHAPHQVPKEWIDKYKGKFDMGWDKYRETVLRRQKKMGIVPKNAKLPPLNPLGDFKNTKSPDGKPFPELEFTKPWNKLSANEKKLFTRMAEVYAGFLEHTDHNIGRLLEFLKQLKQYDNTIIVFVSDNGASAEGGPVGSVNENLFFNGVPDNLQNNLKKIDELGGPNAYNHYPNGWAMAFNTPFKMWKRYCYNGGICDACIIQWPKGLKKKGLRDQYHHAIDIVPTIYEALEIEMPNEVKGYAQKPLEGKSMKYSFDKPKEPTNRETQFYAMLGSRAIWHKGWKAETKHPTVSGWSNFAKDEWELYDVENDRTEMNNLAKKEPEKLEQLKALWYVEAGKYNGLPLDDRTPVEMFIEPRPQMMKDRTRYIYLPSDTSVSEHVAINIRNRSFRIGSEINIKNRNASGIIFQNGSKFGGHALYIKNRKLHYVNNFIGLKDQIITADKAVPMGKHIFGVSFEKKSEKPKGVARGILTLYIDKKKVGQGEIALQPGGYDLAGPGLIVGKTNHEPVTEDYPGKRPWVFTGGDIRYVAFDVSGTPYEDLEKRAEMMMARE
ncbi:arylsulfatase [Patescibacteria group bacterium]|nr:arylsulfatase [Patescibacteria group bacterium]MBU1673585.1 arylsulfatase [Patescibacteria group bacterium]MBU1963487.1 arylsulfatase [Patescibacteria group bacterium]